MTTRDDFLPVRDWPPHADGRCRVCDRPADGRYFGLPCCRPYDGRGVTVNRCKQTLRWMLDVERFVRTLSPAGSEA